MREFIAFDWCGAFENYGRFTAISDNPENNGRTLVCKPYMYQEDWDKAQLEWFLTFSPNIIVYKCETGPYRETDRTYGTIEEICLRLKTRLGLLETNVANAN